MKVRDENIKQTVNVADARRPLHRLVLARFDARKIKRKYRKINVDLVQQYVTLCVSEAMKPETNQNTKMNTSQNIRTEIEAMETRLSEITRQLGEFFRENDNDACIIWPKHLLRIKAEGDQLTIDIKDVERRLAKEEESEARRAEQRARRAEQRARNAEKKQREAFADEKAAVAAADPRKTWTAVNAHRAAAGLPALTEGFIGSAHVQRIALTLGLFSK